MNNTTSTEMIRGFNYVVKTHEYTYTVMKYLGTRNGLYVFEQGYRRLRLDPEKVEVWKASHTLQLKYKKYSKCR